MSRQIVWDDLDKQKYYFYGCSVFLGIRVLVYPTNTIKTRLQVQKGQGHYTGTYDAFCKVFKREGLLGFYRGFHIFALGVIFGQAYITAYEFTKHKCCDLPIFLQGLIPGAAASIAGQSLSVPTDVITQRLQIQGMLKKQEMGSAKGSKLNLTEATVKKHKNRHSVMSVINKIMKYDGITGFYRGFFVSLISNVPTSAIWWAAYNVLLETIGRFTTPDEQGHNKMPIQAMCGVLSGAISAVSTNSLDVIRTRIQVGGSRSLINVTNKLWKEEGVFLFTKGLSARVISMSSSSLLIILGYETVKRLSFKDRTLDSNLDHVNKFEDNV